MSKHLNIAVFNWQTQMERITRKIVNMLKEEKLFYWQGGPVILAQVVLLSSYKAYICTSVPCDFTS